MICLIECGHNRHAQSHHLFTWSGERGEPEVTSRADTVIEIDAMNRYIHDGTVARATRGMCVGEGERGLYASRFTASWLGGMIMPITIHVNCVTIFFKTWSF